MGVEEWASLCGALGVVPGLQWLWRRLGRNPKDDAEARKLNVQADDLIVTRLWAEIERLDHDLRAVREELATVKVAATDSDRAHEREKRALKSEIGRLTLRVEGLEEILRVGPITPEMQALVEELDRKTAKRNRP